MRLLPRSLCACYALVVLVLFLENTQNWWSLTDISISRFVHFLHGCSNSIPHGGRFHPDSNLALFSPKKQDAERMFARGDVCSDAILGTVSNLCSGTTLCCVKPGSAFPQCQTLLGLGFCCVGKHEACYTDMASQCGLDGAVSCSQLGPNVTQACCPKLTVCAHNFNHTTENVRCEIQLSQPPTSSIPVTSSRSTSTSTAYSSGVVTGDTPSSSSSIPSTTSTTTTPSPTPTNPTETSTPTPPLPPPNPPPKSLNGAAIAGICVAAVILLLFALATGFLFRRRRKSSLAKNEFDRQELSIAAPYSAGPAGSFHPAYSYPPQEMAGAWNPPELDSDGREGAEGGVGRGR